MSVNDHIAPGTCNGCDGGRHYDGAAGRAGCVCCRTVDEWVGRAAAESAAGPTELDRTEGDLAVAVREASTARAENERLRANAVGAVRQMERARAERDALSAVIDRITALCDATDAQDWSDVGRPHVTVPTLRSVLAAAGLAAPVGETPTAPKTLLEALGVDPDAPAVKAIEEKMREEFAAIRESERRASIAAQGVVIGDGSSWDSAPPPYVPDETVEPVGETPDEPEVWKHCRWHEPHLAVPVDGSRYIQPGTGATEAACATCGNGEAIVLVGPALPVEEQPR